MPVRRTGLAISKLLTLGAIFWGMIFHTPVKAGEVHGVQSGRWTLANSPYLVTGNVIIPSGMVLVIEPGVMVKFTGYFSFKVEGTLRALGSANQRIIFTSAKDSEFAEAERAETALPTANDWMGIEFTDSSDDEQSRVENCLLKYCRRPLTVKQAYPTLEGITISRSGATQVNLNGKAVSFQDGVERDYRLAWPMISRSAPDIARKAIDTALAFGEIKRDNFFDLHGNFETQFEFDNRDAEGRKSDIDVHRLNVISTFNFAERAFVLAEVGFGHGAEISSNGGQGFIALARSELHLKLREHHQLIIGKFLTPYGIYNLIHDNSPSYIFTRLPFALYERHVNASGQRERDFPKSLAGVQLNGAWPFLHGDLKYFLYAGNGKGAAPFEKDDNTNKAIGMRLLFAAKRERIKLGASFFRGKNGNDANTMQQIAAGDAELRLAGIKLQGEATMNEFDRLDAKGVFLGWQRRALGAYVQASLEAWGRVQPFARYDHYDPDIDFGKDAETGATVGFNVNVMKGVFLKMETHLLRGQAPGFIPYELFIASVAAGF